MAKNLSFSPNDIAGRNGALTAIVGLLIQEVFGESGAKREKLIQDIKEMSVNVPNPSEWSDKALKDFARGFLGIRDGLVAGLEKSSKAP